MSGSAIYEKYRYVLNNMSINDYIEIHIGTINNHKELGNLFYEDTLNRVYVGFDNNNVIPFKILHENKYDTSFSNEVVIDILSYKHSKYYFTPYHEITSIILNNNLTKLYKYIDMHQLHTEYILKMIEYDKVMVINKCVPFSISDVEFFIEKGHIELLLTAPHEKPVRMLNKKQIVYILNFASENKINFYSEFVNLIEDKLNDKLISISLAKTGLYKYNQYIDYDVIKTFATTTDKILSFDYENMEKFINDVKLYKDNDNDINNLYNKLLITDDDPNTEYFEPNDVHDFRLLLRHNINLGKLNNIEKIFDYGEKIIKQFSFYQFNLKITHNYVDKFPYLIWLSDSIDSYYDDDRAYKYGIFKYYSRNVTVMKKVFDKFGKISPYSEINISDEDVEKFFRLKIKESHINKKTILDFIFEHTTDDNNTSLYPRYYDIITGIVNFNWNKCYYLQNTTFYFL